eukprot:CAMPEP_0116877110 /NCGR_PEP_ID=MMETSP0463-20121206/8938_1 /TAXON_ID=181622 /ORGANISM="Strombidinopsis sp, Strain SopsisLIS2011" /LENGTH=65 /DNA_ID=CAMNT_0004524159 /DNA_START=478 /DNA_END=675 /DNA_ORIENTATION=-
MFDTKGDYYYEGKPVDESSTFIDLQVPNAAKFLMHSGGASLKDVKKWFRMEYYEHNYTYHMTDSY